MKTFLRLFSFSAILFAACDKVSPPYQAIPETKPDTTVQVVKKRKILLEDFTGHTCGNCPKAAKEATRLQEANPEQLVVMAIHAGGFAEPVPADGFPSDFRTPSGNELDGFFGVSAIGLPQGMVNRVGFPSGNAVKTHVSWASAVSAELTKPVQAWISIEPTFNSSSRQLSAKVKTEFMQPLSGDIKLAVFLTEDSVISDQKDYLSSPTHITNYVHRHMLRKCLSGNAFGELLASSPQPSATTIDRLYSTTVDAAFAEKHCYLVAYIYDAATYEVIQAEEVKIK